MSCFSGPNEVKNGCVLYYDMNNTQKSFKGMPTTNLCVYDIYNWTDGNATVTRNTTAPIPPPVTGFEISKIQSINGLDTSMDILYTTPIDLAAGINYTHSAYILLTAGTYARVGQHWDPWTAGAIQYIPTGVWTRISETITTVDALHSSIANAYGTDGTIYVTGVQYEKTSFMTPFIPGGTTRTNTQSLLDLTSTNTLTSTSLTYASDNTFSFNGSTDYVDITSSLGVLSNYTISFWCRRDSENKMPVGFRIGSSFYWYGDNSWAYTHGGVVGEYYYSKPTSIPTGTWGHYCVVYNGANVSIYRQGIYQGQQATTGSSDFTSGLRIGYWAGGTGYQFNGPISSVSMYNRALSATEVTQNFNALRGRYGL